MKLYSVKEAAEKIGISGTLLSNWARKGIARPRTSTHGLAQRYFFTMKEIKRLREVKKEGISGWGF